MDSLKLIIYLLLLVVLFSFSCEKNPAKYENNDDGERILFIRFSTNFDGICTIKPNGSDVKLIGPNQSGNSVENYQWARWSPDKKNLVVHGGPGSTLEYQPLWLADSEGNLIKKLIWNGNMPIWTTDGEYVIYSRRRGYFSLTQDIFITNIYSLNEDTLLIAEVDTSTNSGYLYQPLDIMPNNDTRLLLNETYTYTDSMGTQHDEDSELLLFNYNTKNKMYLTDNKLNEGWGRISPTGDLIIYSISNTDDPSHYSNDLYMMSSTGDSLERLTNSESSYYWHSFFAWAPDGKKVAYSRADVSENFNPYSDIYIIDIQTKMVKKITDTAKDKTTSYVMDWK